MTYQSLRKKHTKFTYQSYSYYILGKDLVVQFVFTLSPNIRFEPKVIIKNIDEKRLRALDVATLENFIFHLGLAEIPSYWKSAVSPEIIIEAGYLSKEQISWWNNLLENGLGEFFYINKIPFSGSFLKITTTQKPPKNKVTSLRLKNRYIVPIGGGKDSFVTAHLLKETKTDFRPLVLGAVPAALNSSRAVSSESPIQIERKIDPQLTALNKKGYLNGHTPFSSYLAFLTVFCGLIFDYQHIAISQEQSSNEGNIKIGRKSINHQYSKSFSFEKKFREYLKKYLSRDINFFSFLRPLSELQITKIFIQTPEYFKTFKSCNVNLKEDSWCGKCPKCFTIYLLLASFLKEKELVKIFGKNLLDDLSLWSYIPAFLGKSGARPFDCISSIKETSIALSMAIKKYEAEGKNLPSLLHRYQKEFHPRRDTNEGFLRSWDKNNFVPQSFQKTLKERLK